MTSKVWIVYGPTASGKSNLVYKLAEIFPIMIINMDAVQVYRDFNIGAAKPEAKLFEQYPHALFDIVQIPDEFSVAEYTKALDQAIQSAFKANLTPVLVGGTMLYLNAILQGGLITTPVIPPNIQAWINTLIAPLKQSQRYDALLSIDPVWAKRIHPNDQQRTSRGLSLALAYQQPGSKFFKQNTQPLYDTVLIAIEPSERHWLHTQIAQRTEAMLDAGLVTEVKTLIQCYPDYLSHFMFRSIGYRQVLSWLNTSQDKAHLQESITIATRQFAKRQLTWMRRFKPDIVFDPIKNELNSVILSAKSHGICRQ